MFQFKPKTKTKTKKILTIEVCIDCYRYIVSDDKGKSITNHYKYSHIEYLFNWFNSELDNFQLLYTGDKPMHKSNNCSICYDDKPSNRYSFRYKF